MRKLVVIVAMLALATCAFAQLSYVGTAYTGPNVQRSQDTKLGYHDVMAGATGPNVITDASKTALTVQADYNGCQSCHVPHGATTGEYIWKYNLATSVKNQDGSAMAVDDATFHTVACITCHDGVDAPDVYTYLRGGVFPDYAAVSPDLSTRHDHPINAVLSQHGSTAPARQYVRFYSPAGWSSAVAKNADGSTPTGYQFGYVECGTCHDPHKGDGATYMFLRGPSGGTTPQYARIGLCRDCHGK